jgi:hypothetical protein
VAVEPTANHGKDSAGLYPQQERAEGLDVSFCEHCQGQRFDRAQVLRALRQLREELRATEQDSRVDAALRSALEAVRELEIPHLEPEAPPEDVVVH